MWAVKSVSSNKGKFELTLTDLQYRVELQVEEANVPENRREELTLLAKKMSPGEIKQLTPSTFLFRHPVKGVTWKYLVKKSDKNLN